MPVIWKRRAEALRRRVNLGWFWVEFSKGMVFCASVSALLLWLLRLQKVPLLPAWLLGLISLVVAVLMAQSRSAPRKIGLEQALSRLDVGWRMNHRLVSAWRGVGQWPGMPERRLPLKLNSAHAFAPLLLSMLFLMSALLLPLPPENLRPDFARAEPADWSSLQTLAEELEEQALVEENALRTLKSELHELREKPMEAWYDQSTLEATDRLRNRVRNDAQSLMQAMENTSALLRLADQGRQELQPQQQQAMQEFLQRMRDQMGQGGLNLPPDLLRQLQEVDLTQLQQIDPVDLQRLEEQLERNCEGMCQALVAAGLMDGGDGEMPGAGGISRGGGPAALTLRDFETTVDPVIPMGLTSGSLENARIGDLLELRDTEHTDERESVSASAGRLRSGGGVGEVVWERDVLPSEQHVLKEFFK